MRLALALLLLSACSDDSNAPGIVCGDGGDGYFRRADAVGCNVVRGTLQLGDDFESNVDELSELREVTGQVVIFRSNLTNLDGLRNLQRVGGDLFVHHTDRLESLSGLRSLRYVGGNLTVRSNALIPQSEVDAFAKKLEVGGELQTSPNP